MRQIRKWLLLAGLVASVGCGSQTHEQEIDYSVPPGAAELFAEALASGNYLLAAQHSTIPASQLERLPVPKNASASHGYIVRGSEGKFPYQVGVFTVFSLSAENYEGSTQIYVASVEGQRKVVAISSPYLEWPNDA